MRQNVLTNVVRSNMLCYYYVIIQLIKLPQKSSMPSGPLLEGRKVVAIIEDPGFWGAHDDFNPGRPERHTCIFVTFLAL